MSKYIHIRKDYMSSQRKAIGSKIAKRRIELGMSTEALAELVGVKYITIVKIETGAFDFKIDLLIRISVALSFEISLNESQTL